MDTSFYALGQRQRAKTSASGYGADTITGLERKRALGRMNPNSAPVAGNDIFGNAMERNNDDFRWDRINGGNGAPMIGRARELAPLNAAENMAGIDPAQRANMMMPLPMADTGEGSLAPKPREPDPFAGGYQAKGRDDPYTTHPRKRFATGGTIEGPGGPTDDMIPGVVDGQMPVRLSSGERVQKASTRDWLGEKFFVDLDKKADKERAEFEADKLRPKSRHSAYPMPVLNAETSMSIPGYAEGGTLDRLGEAATRARIRDQDAMLSPDPYGPTLNDSPVFQPMPMRAPLPGSASSSTQPEPQFQPDPGVLASLRQRRRDLRGMPELNQSQQPAINVASPMDPLPMRPAPMTMTEKDRLNMPLRPSVTPQVAPDFEASLVGQSGMGKRRNRAAYLQEQALWNRDNQRNQAKEATAATRAQQNREQDFTEWQQKQVIGDQFQQAAENRRIGTTAAMNAADDQQKQAAAAAAAESNRRFSPVLDADGNPIPGRMMNPQGQQLNTEPTRAEGIRMEPVPGMPGRVLPMMGGSRVPGMPMMQANTAPGPFREGLGRTTFTPVQETEAAKAPTVRKTAPRKGFSAEAPEWDYASLSDGSTRPITIDNPLPTQTKERFQHQYGRAPQTEQEWTEAWYLTTGQPMPAGNGKPAAASASAAPTTRAKIKSITPVS